MTALGHVAHAVSRPAAPLTQEGVTDMVVVFVSEPPVEGAPGRGRVSLRGLRLQKPDLRDLVFTQVEAFMLRSVPRTKGRTWGHYDTEGLRRALAGGVAVVEHREEGDALRPYVLAVLRPGLGEGAKLTAGEPGAVEMGKRVFESASKWIEESA